MNKKKKNTIIIFSLLGIFVILFFPSDGVGCTMILAGKDATGDGSVLLAHNNDLPDTIASLIRIIPGQKHEPGEMILFKNGLKIPQAAQTFRMLMMNCYYGFSEGDAVAINEYQVAIAGGVALKGDQNREAQEADPLIKTGVSGYIRYIALQRSRTARECVEIIGKIYSTYGISYPSGVGVADPNEVWYMEAGGGKCWAAQRVPNDAYLAVANGYRIGAVDFEDKKNFIYPPYLKKFAIEKGLWETNQKVFDFAKIFGGKKQTENNHYNARRVWRAQHLLTPSLEQDPDAFTHPVMLKAGKKITISRLIGILRDYYKETPYDVSKNISRQPGSKERAIGVFHTVHTDVIQLRSNMPPEIGAVIWGGVSSSLTTPYIPYYLGIKEIPSPYGAAGPQFDNNSAFWHFRTLTTLLELGFYTLIKEILPVWETMEGRLLSLQEPVEKTALELYKNDKEAARDFLTFYTYGLSLKALQMAKELNKKIKSHFAKTNSKAKK
jgi:dipeptidase